MKLSKRFLLVPLVLAVFSYLFYSAYTNVRNKTLNDFNSQQFALAKQASVGIESFFIYYQRELQFLAKLKYISELNDQGKSLLKEFYISHSDQIEAITVVDKKGILIYTFPFNETVIGQDISGQEHVKSVIETHKPTVSDVFTAIQGYRAIAYHIPIMTGNEYNGSIAILIPIETLGKRFIENIKTGETGYGWMISEDGIELFNPKQNEVGISAKETYKKIPPVLDLLERTSKEKEGTALFTPIRTSEGINMLSKTFAAFYRVTLDNTFWTILIFTPEKEVFETMTSFRNRLGILLVLIIISMVIYFHQIFKANNILAEQKKRKALDEIVRESEIRFRTIFELSPVGIILINEKGTIIEVNSTFCETLGYSREELLSENIRLFASPDKKGDVEKNIAKILSGETLKHEVSNFRKDGSVCSISLYETLISLPDGKTGILSVSNDITEKKLSQERMLTLSRALESISECVSITDLKNKVIFVNNAFCRTYGYSKEELIGKDIEVFRSLKTIGRLGEKILADSIKGGWTGELVNVRKDGTEFPIELSTSLIKDENGVPAALIGIAVDISDRKKVHEELIKSKEKAEESDKLKSSFLANMSHELRTPLNAIIGFSGLMAESGFDTEPTSYSKIIYNSGQHLLGLVEDILDISMIETGQIKLNIKKTGINSLLNEVKNIIQGEIIKENKSEIKLLHVISNKEAETYIYTDSRKLKQVLINLLKNALKFTNEGFIEFGFTETEKSSVRYLEFYVKDTGIGIEKKYHDVIFNIFRQVDDTHTRKFGGTGIGLSIAKKIVEMLGGEIWVDSEPGKGSVFYFTVPVSSDKKDKESKITEKTGIIENDYSGKTVLIAEDELSNYEFLRIFFTKMNIRVLWAKNGIEAIELCESDPSINLVMMDIKMPILNGFEATRKIKEKRPDLPIIAQTAYAMLADKEESLRYGCNDYLSKPIQINQLKDLLKKYL